MPTERALSTRFPAALADAIEARARALGSTASEVIRTGAVREVCAPLDRRSKAFVQLWLDAQETTEAGEPAGVTK
jgi:hypothetical protein